VGLFIHKNRAGVGLAGREADRELAILYQPDQWITKAIKENALQEVRDDDEENTKP
jgi:hypothetical protein